MAAKPQLSRERAIELIEEASASDRENARQAIARGVQAAEAKWIEAPLIAEALALELIVVAQNNQHSKGVAAYLRQLADTLETQTDLH